MILNKDSLIQLLTQNGCEYCSCPPSLTYNDYRFLSFNHWFYDTDTDFRLHTHLTKTLLTNHDIRCKYTNTSPEFILSHLEKFKMWVDRLSLNEKKEKLSKMVDKIQEDF